VSPNDPTEVRQEDDLSDTQKVLMVRAKNLVHEPFESTQEIKVKYFRFVQELYLYC